MAARTRLAPAQPLVTIRTGLPHLGTGPPSPTYSFLFHYSPAEIDACYRYSQP